MNTAAKLSAYGAALALLVAGGWATGTAVGPLTTATATPGGHGATSGGEDAGLGDTHSGTVAEAAGTEPARSAGSGADQPGGLASSRGGYTLTPTDPTPTAGTFSFTVTGPDGAPVTAFDVGHDERMHLIVVRRDTTDFQHGDAVRTAEFTVPTATSGPAAPAPAHGADGHGH